MHRVLQIHELMGMVFDLSDKPTLASAARTTTAWSELALDKLWEFLDTLVPLLDLLGELRFVDVDGRRPGYQLNLDFCNRLGPGDWSRFMAMGKRVKSLFYSDRGLGDNRWVAAIEADAFTQLASRQQTGLLPNLIALHWDCCDEPSFRHLPLFLSESLRNIQILISPEIDDIESIDELFSSITRHSPLLERLSLHTCLSADVVEGPLIRFFSTAKTLRGVFLPMFFATESIVSTLAIHPSLQELGHIISFVPDGPRPRTCIHQLRPNWFRGLTTLWFQASMDEARSLLRSPHHPPLLNDLGIIVTSGIGATTTESLEDVVTLIATNYPRLKHLDIDLREDYQLESAPVHYNTLSLLASCPDLFSLHIKSNHPIQLTKDQIVDMGKNWPSLTSLYLANDPVNMEGNGSGGLLLELLPLFSCFKNLTDLGLYLDTSSPPSPPSARLSKLELLNAGHSSIKVNDIRPTAVFLRQLLASGTELYFGLGTYSIDVTHKMPAQVYVDNPIMTGRWREVKQAISLGDSVLSLGNDDDPTQT